jgi:hypothetical protein
MIDQAHQYEYWIEEHDRLSDLFRNDRVSFERERRRLIHAVIDRSTTVTGKRRLINLQERWDRILKHAGSAHNRFILIQMLFWDQVNNRWLPALNGYQRDLKSLFSRL